MAQETLLTAVSDAQIAKLHVKPAAITKLAGGSTFSTYYLCSLNYFLTGEPYPTRHKLAPVLIGKATIATRALSAGSFGIVPAADAKKLAARLAKVDVAAIEVAVKEADFEALGEEDVDDADSLADEKDPAKTVGTALRALAAFYRDAAAAGLGVVMFTE